MNDNTNPAATSGDAPSELARALDLGKRLTGTIYADNTPGYYEAMSTLFNFVESQIARIERQSLSLEAVAAALGDHFDAEVGHALSVRRVIKAWQAEAALGETYKGIAQDSARIERATAPHGSAAPTEAASFEAPGHKDCYCGGWTDNTGDFHQQGCPEIDAEQASQRAAAPKRQMPPEMKAAIDAAHKTGATSALTSAGDAVFINYGHDYGDSAHLECTACGGSGHIEDQKQRAAAPVSGAHHLEPDNIVAVIKDLREIEDGTTERPIEGRDWRTWAGVLARIMEHLSARAAVSASQAAPVGGGELERVKHELQVALDTNKRQNDAAVEVMRERDQLRAAVAAAKVPTVDQVADVVERLIGNVVLDWFGGRIDGDDEPFSSDAHERAYLCEMIRLHGGIGEPAAAPVERGQGAAPSEKAAAANAGGRDAVRDAVAQALDGIYYCGRVWSAWSVGTMREGDFTPAAEVDDVLDEITDAAIAAMPRAAATSAGVQAPAAYFSAESASLLQDIAARPENTSTTIRIHNRSDQWHGHVLPIYTDRTAPVGAGEVPEEETGDEIYEDVYDQIIEMINPYVAAGAPIAGMPFPASVVGAVSMLLDHWKTSQATTPTAATAHPVAADDQVRDTLEQKLIEHRIGITPENEGGFHAFLYGDQEEAQARGYGQTPSAAVDAAIQSRTTAHGGAQGEQA